MVTLIIFNLVLLAMAVAVMTRMLPTGFLGSLIDGLHKSIGITAPTPNQIRWVVVVWLVSMVVIVDMMLFLFAYVF
jgi:hypothetical protein